MSELEKKLSDFQQSECKDFELDTSEDQGQKVCPTCIPNPNFILPADWWEIEEAYLNEAECEYHVAIYPVVISGIGPINPTQDVKPITDEQIQIMLKFASEKILKDLRKPYNGDILKQVSDVAFIKDGPFTNGDSKQKGPAYLIAVQSFNIDNIDDEDVDDEVESDFNASLEVVVDAVTLTRNIRQLRTALEVYKSYYRLAQQTDRKGFAIRQEGNKAIRISYSEPRKKLRAFKDELNVYLKRKNYAKLQHTGMFAAKRAKSLKFVFKDNGKDYDLDDVYVLSDNGCSEYEPLKVRGGSILRSPTMRIVYHFMSRIDQMFSEFQAKEPKPWAEWTLDHWYPTMVLENKSDLDLEDTETGLKCLLEQQLGLGPEVLDSLAKEILSAFKVIEKEGQKQACRKLDEKAEKSATALANNSGKSDPTPTEQRKATMVKRYKQEYKNQWLQYVKQILDGTEGVPSASLNTIFQILEGTSIYFEPKTYKVKGKPTPYASKSIDSAQRLDDVAGDYAKQKFEDLENAKGMYKGFGNQIQNSPHYQEALDSIREAAKPPENGAIELFKGNVSLSDIGEALTLCSVSKLGKTAAQCILGNISISDFYDAMLDKLFEFMKINTLDLFLAGIPAGVRSDLDEAIKREFGDDMNLFDLIAIKKVNEGEAKLFDVTKNKQVAKELIKIYEKQRKGAKLTEDELSFEASSIDSVNGRTEEAINNYLNDPNNKDAKKQAIKLLKKDVRKYKKERDGNSFKRVTSFTKGQNPGDADPKKLSKFEMAAERFDETAVGKKADVVFDVVFDFTIDWVLEEFSVDELIEDLRGYPVLDFIGDQMLNSLSCPNAPIFYPPPSDFMKGLSLDVCNPTKLLETPKIVWPNINPFVFINSQFSEIIREKIIEICGDIIERVVKRLVNTIEGALCSVLGVGINALADYARDRESAKDTFLDALNEAFCNGAENPETSRSRAEELAEALFTPLLFQEGNNIQGSAEKIVNVISSVASADEFLESLVAREGEENNQFGRRISNAVNTLTPEISALLGSPDQVAYFFRTIGSFLSTDDRERIRDLLDSGIPNLPISKSICLTDEQLEDWNDLRKELLSEYPNPEDIVDDLNDRTLQAADDLLGILGDLDSDGPFLAPLVDEINKDSCNPNNILNDTSQSDFDRQLESDAIDSDYENLTRVMSYSFMRKNGLLGWALRDKENNSEFKRMFYKFIFPGYTNSSVEWQNKYDSKRALGKLVMDNYNDGNPQGNYPETVGMKQREEILDGMIEYDFESVKSGIRSSRNVVFKYKDTQEPNEYRLHIAGSLLRGPKKVFGYNVQVLEKLDDEKFTRELNFNTPISISEKEDEYMKSVQFESKSNDEQDIRKEAFNNIIRSKLPINRNYAQLFEKTYETSTQNIVEALLTDTRKPDGIPAGYKFGYTSDTLTKDSFKYYNPDGVTEYNLDEEDQTLGVFGSPRITELDPGSYGGKYSRPKYYRQRTACCLY